MEMLSKLLRSWVPIATTPMLLETFLAMLPFRLHPSSALVEVFVPLQGYICKYRTITCKLYYGECSDGPTKKMHYVTVKQAAQPLVDQPKEWYDTNIPMFYPNEVLAYLFDDVGLKVPQEVLRNYWTKARNNGVPWAAGAEEPFRLPIKLFADDAAVNDQGDKVFAFVISCPLYRPKNSRTSKWPLALVDLRRSVGWHTIRPIISHIVASLNLAYDNATTRGFKFQVTEIGMDWKALRECFQMESHWNAKQLMCHMCRMNGKDYCKLPEALDWRTTSDFVTEVLVDTNCTPLILLRNFHVSCIVWCSLHNLNLGLLWTMNGGALALLLEMNVYGNLTGDGYASCLKRAYADFKLWQNQPNNPRCSQKAWTYNSLFKKGHGAYLAAKGYNSRCICAYLADKTKSVLDVTNPPTQELQLVTHTLLLYSTVREKFCL